MLLPEFRSRGLHWDPAGPNTNLAGLGGVKKDVQVPQFIADSKDGACKQSRE